MPKGRKQKAKHWKAFADKRKFAFFARTKEVRDLSREEAAAEVETQQEKMYDDQDV